MCDRKKDEPLLVYVFRMACEQPRGVLTIIGWVVAGLACWALYYLYQDSKERSERQTEAYLEVGRLIERQDARLQALDEHIRQLDIWHKQECMKNNENR